MRNSVIAYSDEDVTIGETIRRLAKLPLEFEPGVKWNYSNSIDVLGYLIGATKNQETPNVVRRQSAAKVQIQRERAVLGDEIDYHVGRKDKYRP